MGNYLDIFKKALEAPKIEGLDLITHATAPNLVKLLENAPSHVCISEWRHGFGIVSYEYHIHTDESALQLRKAYEAGAKGGLPKLTALYSKKDLESLTQQYRAPLVTSQDSQQTHY